MQSQYADNLSSCNQSITHEHIHVYIVHRGMERMDCIKKEGLSYIKDFFLHLHSCVCYPLYGQICFIDLNVSHEYSFATTSGFNFHTCRCMTVNNYTQIVN